MDNLQTLLTELCRDDKISKADKQTMLANWEATLVELHHGRLLDKESMEKYIHGLEMIGNAQRIVGTREATDD